MPKAKKKKKILYLRILGKEFLLKESKKLKLTLTAYVQELINEQMKRVCKK